MLENQTSTTEKTFLTKIFTQMGEPLYTTQQVAQILNRDERTIRGWISKGKATPYCEAGGVHFWRRQDFENVAPSRPGRKPKPKP